MMQKAGFTFVHGLVASLFLHAAVVAPFAAGPLLPHQPDDDEPLVIDLKGILTETQAEERREENVQPAETAPPQPAAEPTIAQPEPPPPPPPPEEPPPEPPVEDPQPAPPPEPPKPQVQEQVQEKRETPATPAVQVAPVEQTPQEAQTIRKELTEDELMRAYVRGLSQKLRRHVVHSNPGQKLSAVVSFTVMADGRLRPGSAQIVKSSGRPGVDANALATVRASAPFPRPPREVTVSLTLDSGG